VGKSAGRRGKKKRVGGERGMSGGEVNKAGEGTEGKNKAERRREKCLFEILYLETACNGGKRTTLIREKRSCRSTSNF